jgi:hypothetical protein
MFVVHVSNKLYWKTVESKVKHNIVRQICDSLPKENANGKVGQEM